MTETVDKIAWPDPSEEMLKTPEFEAVWKCIKGWDISVPLAYNGYEGATGNHVRAILDALGVAREKLLERLVQMKKLQALTLDNEIRWMRKHDDLLALVESLRDWKSPDGVLQVKDLHWFATIAHKEKQP